MHAFLENDSSCIFYMYLSISCFVIHTGYVRLVKGFSLLQREASVGRWIPMCPFLMRFHQVQDLHTARIVVTQAARKLIRRLLVNTVFLMVLKNAWKSQQGSNACALHAKRCIYLWILARLFLSLVDLDISIFS